MGLESFEFFREYYLGHRSYACQVQWGKTFLEHLYALLLCPGGHGKSWELVDLFTWLIVRNRFAPVYGAQIGELNLAILSLSQPFVERWIRQIKNYLECPKIVADYGVFRNQAKWTTDSILVLSPNNKSAMVDHPTLTSIGIGGQVFGPRVHGLGFDDIVDKENSGTEEARRKLWETFAEGPLSWVRPGGFRWGIGTRMNSRDLYARILKQTNKVVYEDDLTKIHKGSQWVVRVDRAVNFETGRILAPEEKKYTVRYFKDDKFLKGTPSFNRRYMNVAIDEADAPFGEEMFAEDRLYDFNRPWGHTEDSWRVFIGADPAVGIGKGRSHFAACAIGYDPKDPSRRYLIDWVSDQMAPEQQADTLLRWFSLYHAERLRIEKNACQLYLKSYIQERSERYGINPRIDMTFTGAQKWDVEFGVNVVAAAFENGRFRIPYADGAKEKAHRLRDLLLECEASKPIDVVMALWFVEQHLQSFVKRKMRNVSIEREPYLQLVRTV